MSKPKSEDNWEGTFFKVYGESILKLYEAAYKVWHPDYGNKSNVAFEAGMDFQSRLKLFISSLISETEDRVREEDYDKKVGDLTDAINVITNACQLMDSYFQAPHEGNPSEWDIKTRQDLGVILKRNYALLELIKSEKE